MIVRDGLAMQGIRGPLRLEDILFQARKATRIAPVQIVRADRVFGPEHVDSAAMHARRAIDEGRNHADSIEVEFVRYLAGERQIRKALEHVGIPDVEADAGAPVDGVVVGFGDKAEDAIRYFTHGLGLAHDDAVLAASLDDLDAFGITDALRAATPESRWLHLPLERVAAVDLMRK